MLTVLVTAFTSIIFYLKKKKEAFINDPVKSDKAKSLFYVQFMSNLMKEKQEFP